MAQSERITEDELQEVDEMLSRATPGPWRWVGWNFGGDAFWRKDGDWLGGRLVSEGATPRGSTVLDAAATEGEYARVEVGEEADALLVERSREILPRLVAEVRRLRELIIGMDARIAEAASGAVTRGSKILYLAEEAPGFFAEARAARDEWPKIQPSAKGEKSRPDTGSPDDVDR